MSYLLFTVGIVVAFTCIIVLEKLERMRGMME